MAPVQRSGSRLLAALATALAAAACDFSDDSDGSASGTPPPLAVTSMEPTLFVAYRPTAFTVRGSGFTGGSGSTTGNITTGVIRRPVPAPLQEAVVTLRASTGTPFANGTSATAQVPGTVISDTEIQATSPVTSASGAWQCGVEVSVASAFGASTAPLAVFAGLIVYDIDQEVIAADQATSFEVLGFNFLPLGGTATIRFTSGASTLDVQGTVVGSTRITGVTPVFTLSAPVQAFVTVILDQEPGAPQATSSAALVTFAPPPAIPLAVTSILPSSLPLGIATSFTITGSGFQGAGGSNVEVTFTATAGTPFSGGTAAVVTVLGTATLDTQITGTSPTGTSTTDVNAFVKVTRTDGVSRTSATPIALFTAPVATVSEFTPLLLPVDVGTAFTITGTNFPAPGAAVVRFRAVEGTPFTGGTTETVDVPGTITSATQIDGTSPLATATIEFLAEVTVILPNAIELPMGVSCMFVSPGPPSFVVTNLDDSGAGSLRDTILNAPAGSIVSFAPLLAGTLVTASTIAVPRSMHILGPTNGAISVHAPSATFPVFTIEATATAAIVDQLEVFGSRQPGDGGAFFVQGGLTLNRCQLVDHAIGGRGGAVFVDAGATFAATECAFSTNTSQVKGGAVFLASGATAQVSASSFAENWATLNGAAFFVTASAVLSVVNCTFNANVTLNGTGGVAYVESTATLNLQHCTLAKNVALAGGGGVFVSSLGTLNATNCLFRNVGPSPEILNQGTNNTTFSLLRDGSGSDLTHGVNGNLVGTSSAPINPDLGLFLFNGGPTKTHALKPTSPALHVGTPSAVLKDQRGAPRPAGPGPDMGAYEAEVIL